MKGSRVEDLISAFNRYYQGAHVTEGKQVRYDHVAENEIISLLKNGNFLKASIKESQLFEGKSKEALTALSVRLYMLYQETADPYEKIPTALLLSRLFGYYLPDKQALISVGNVPYDVVKAIEDQKFEEALHKLQAIIICSEAAPEAVLKGIGTAFHGRALQLLEQEVQHCIQKDKPSLFIRCTPATYNIRIPEHVPVEIVRIPVRIELTSSVGSDIFLLSMACPETARCINISVDLFDERTGTFDAPIRVLTRPIKERGIRLTSVDLGCSALITSVDDVFNMRNDDLSLLKAAVIASGIVPPAIKDSPDFGLQQLLDVLLVNLPDMHGFELITRVVQIPRGSGLAVSTNLLAGMIISLMRFSGQFTGAISEVQKRDVATRAIYAEWLGGSGGGWQDYGGMWGGFKEIKAVVSAEGSNTRNLLPEYTEMQLSDDVVNNILDAMVLVNGGTGQDVGPVLKMITFQFATKNDDAWEARLQTISLYDKIKTALQEGDARKLAALEQYDFTNRVRISPLANNYYHDTIFQKLKTLLGEDLWGYDSTGGRAGAGGVFWINPEKRQLFQSLFIKVGSEVQEELKGQIHFASDPLVYRFRINHEGVVAEPADEASLTTLVNLHAVEEKEPEADGTADILKVKRDYGYDDKLFTSLQSEYKNGNLSLVRNTHVAKDRIKTSLPKEQFQHMCFPGSADYEKLYAEGVEYLKAPIAYVVLNGGESTRYGTHVIRSLNPSIYLKGKYCSPIELKMANIKFVRDRFKTRVMPVFVNGYFTDLNTNRVLRNNNYFGVPQEDVFSCTHEVIHRVIPTVNDLDYWFHRIREKTTSQREEVLATQYHEAMRSWIQEQGEGEIYAVKGKNKISTLVSPGHFFSFMSLVTKGVLGTLIKRGVKHLIVSSNDNLMSTIDPAIFALHVNQKNKVTSEIVPRLFDRGGTPVVMDGKIQIFEDFRFADQQMLWEAPYFNPITSWITTDAILQLLEISEQDIIRASEGDRESIHRCREAVATLAKRFSTYPILKHVGEDMGKGISYTFPVIQFEKLFGDLMSAMNPAFLLVPKLMRHTQIKSVDHIYHVYNDRSLEVLGTQIQLLDGVDDTLKFEAVASNQI